MRAELYKFQSSGNEAVVLALQITPQTKGYIKRMINS